MMKDFFKEVMGPVLVIIVLLFITLGIPIAGVCYISASKEVAIYNQYHQTSYTAGDFFWAGETIKEFNEEGRHYQINLQNE